MPTTRPKPASPNLTTIGLTAPRAAERARPLLTLLEVTSEGELDVAGHGEAVGHLSAALAERLGMPPSQIGRLRLAGVLHDVGKVAVPDAVPDKAGPLSEGEWATVRRHPEIGYRLIHSVGLEDIAGWVLAHHERPDGLGYPYGSSGDEIPVEAAILSVADAYHAMVSPRPYQEAVSADAARAELFEGAGTQFDRTVVDAALSVFGAAGRFRA